MTEFEVIGAGLIKINLFAVPADKYTDIWDWCRNQKHYHMIDTFIQCATPEDVTMFLLRWA